uniref:Patatin like phospholipase domain containing 8 n=1 Tax=Callorhinchus milii TaxID=7868 RepID=A0A4W3IWL6_CALMI
MSMRLVLDYRPYVLNSETNLWFNSYPKEEYCSSHPLRINSQTYNKKPLYASSKSKERTSSLKYSWCKWSRKHASRFTNSNNCQKHTFPLHCMSRIKSTFNTVSKAVSSTHTELIGKLVRLKPSLNVAGKTSEVETQVKCETSNQLTTSNSSEAQDNSGNNQILETVSKSQAGNKNDGRSSLFHSSYITTNFEETYNFVATHVNSYFGSAAQMDLEKAKKTHLLHSKKWGGSTVAMSESFKFKADREHNEQTTDHKLDNQGLNDSIASSSVLTESGPPTIPPSSKKSLVRLLSKPTNSVQAFVDSYFSNLVPKLRTEMKGNAEVLNKESECENKGKSVEQDKSKESKAVEEKVKHLSLQREKIIAKVSVDNRTRGLVQALHRASDVRVYINRVEELNYHLLEFPETRTMAVKEKVIPCLLRLRQVSDEVLQETVREALALVGYTDPVKGHGIRVLSIDGGGTRGLVALQTLRQLEQLTGKPVYQLFDYICGVSTGAILAFMLGLFHISLDECEEMYHKLGSDVFKQNVIVGTMKMSWSHAFYESEPWEKILKERMSENLMIQTARDQNSIKVAAVSTIVNKGTPLKAFVFRNYNHLPSVRSHYMGGCQSKLWQAIRASSAAPGYFQEYAIGSDLHQDGGLLINNPCALAIHECKCLWPNTPLQCVISLGTGRYETLGKNSATYTSLKTKLTNVISSATDTEEVHTMLDALLPPNTYFRFNPFMSEDVVLDESRREKLNQLQMDGTRYLERNELKLKKAAEVLCQEKGTFQKMYDWFKLKADMYDGLPLTSKL